MKIFNEQALINHNMRASIAMLDVWKKLTQELFRTNIELGLVNRREHPQFNSFSGELNTACIHKVASKVMLIVYVDNTSNVKDIIVSHEIGHWVLKLQGFKALQDKFEKNTTVEILFNSMCQHIPLYALQRSLGFDPQEEIDDRVKHNRNIFSNSRERTENIIPNALLVADDLLNCTEFRKGKYIKALNSKHPQTMTKVKTITEYAKGFNLLEPEENLKFATKVSSFLNKDRQWLPTDEIVEIKKLLDD